MQIIGIIFNVFFLFILVLMMGFGFLFGMWRKLRSFGGLLLGVILLIILMNPIANGIVNTELPFIDKSITGLVVEVISQEVASGAVIAEDGELALLCSSIALSAAKIIVLFVGMLGIHKFIKGEVGMGILYFFTGGLFGIGWLIDVIKAGIALGKK